VLRLSVLFAMPGIVIHELGHYLLCRLCGAQVHEVVFFDPAGPSGYVVHSVPRRLGQHATIVAGPLLLNSVLGFLLFRAAVTDVGPALAELEAGLPVRIVELIVAGLLGASIALHAIPSRADASSLWEVTLDRIGRGHLLAILAAPIALILMVANHLRRYWIDWVYAIALAALAVWFPAT
jgi:hypothetical protein